MILKFLKNLRFKLFGEMSEDNDIMIVKNIYFDERKKVGQPNLFDKKSDQKLLFN